MKKNKNEKWLGFFGFFALFAIPGIIQGDLIQSFWLIWAVWFLYFFKK